MVATPAVLAAFRDRNDPSEHLPPDPWPAMKAAIELRMAETHSSPVTPLTNGEKTSAAQHVGAEEATLNLGVVYTHEQALPRRARRPTHSGYTRETSSVLGAAFIMYSLALRARREGFQYDIHAIEDERLP
jgi:hypothetical protein